MAAKNSKTRTIGYITLTLAKDDPTGWLLDIERIDPYGGRPFQQGYWFEEKDTAESWFKSINGNEDIIALHQQSDLPSIQQYELPGSIWWLFFLEGEEHERIRAR